jgi:RNA-directed DNA polymerase
MQVLYIEDLANHGGPESCVGCSRGWRRSVDRGRAGWAIEPRNQSSGVPTLSNEAEGNIAWQRYRELLEDPARSENPGMHEVLHAREPGEPTVARACR